MTKLHDFVTTFLKVKKPIVQYLRDKQNRKIGVMIAYRHSDQDVVVGWSKVNESAGDVFNREYGIARALDPEKRCPLEEFEAFVDRLPHVPEVLLVDGSRITQYDDFIFRAKNYFFNKKKFPKSTPLESTILD